ncbi:hypothetical protein, unlikely [Trypanosoma brucei gambiense DAL972]|uniref:Uncharacterized protein n=1 Tax=Trypanosoma brucei gambiense (strain MHOM/CI/86/DAL972) TaxID=679716 RepID=C9ZJZ1_TRYB9|nr:hypothetical protein, unlikely [Trypanosoma brucei gambiense DAL972]CBH09755.1 hypothetical protein, unlikely [Trypanosoma brucei gambiense DAL972]|eukprot:XP_011772048.1 hypothetical protein, unlikely [Trypanosoma brucei gambiense DAL972]
MGKNKGKFNNYEQERKKNKGNHRQQCEGSHRAVSAYRSPQHSNAHPNKLFLSEGVNTQLPHMLPHIPLPLVTPASSSSSSSVIDDDLGNLVSIAKKTATRALRERR